MPPEPAMARVENTDQVRMRQSGGYPPARELGLIHGRVRGDELDGGIGKTMRAMFGQEYHAVVRSAQEAAQGEHPVDNQPFPLRPVLSHRLSSTLPKGTATE